MCYKKFTLNQININIEKLSDRKFVWKTIGKEVEKFALYMKDFQHTKEKTVDKTYVHKILKKESKID